ncbi:hypothetical protein SNEBB_002118 [Seison nebaliae]|nr:hypothetical protein SNEBB_002118 [Seison nebaliae]
MTTNELNNGVHPQSNHNNMSHHHPSQQHNQKSFENVYKIGDFAYYEESPITPYKICKIEELLKSSNGPNEVRLTFYLRREELSQTLLNNADKQIFGNYISVSKVLDVTEEIKKELDDYDEEKIRSLPSWMKDEKEEQTFHLRKYMDKLTKYQVKHRELFHNRESQCLPVDGIKGKCQVLTLDDEESLWDFVDIRTPLPHIKQSDHRQHVFFTQLTYDPHLKTLVNDRSEIRVGPKYQAEIPEMYADDEMEHYRNALYHPSTLVWDQPDNCSDMHVDRCVMLGKSIGMYARAIDTTHLSQMVNKKTLDQHVLSVKMKEEEKQENCRIRVNDVESEQQISNGTTYVNTTGEFPLLPTASFTLAAASRDLTLNRTYDILHLAEYDVEKMIKILIPKTGPRLFHDELEAWSIWETNLFEDAVERYKKEFFSIRNDVLPWKSLRSIIEYYYLWKTTNHYAEMKHRKSKNKEGKLKQIFIPEQHCQNFNPIPFNQKYSCLICKLCVERGTWYNCPHHLLNMISQKVHHSSSELSQEQHPFLINGNNDIKMICLTCIKYWKYYGGIRIPIGKSTVYSHDHNSDLANFDNRQFSEIARCEKNKNYIRNYTEQHRFTCSKCGRKFQTKNTFDQHSIHAHGKVEDVSAMLPSSMPPTNQIYFFMNSEKRCERLALYHSNNDVVQQIRRSSRVQSRINLNRTQSWKTIFKHLIRPVTANCKEENTTDDDKMEVTPSGENEETDDNLSEIEQQELKHRLISRFNKAIDNYNLKNQEFIDDENDLNEKNYPLLSKCKGLMMKNFNEKETESFQQFTETQTKPEDLVNSFQLWLTHQESSNYLKDYRNVQNKDSNSTKPSKLVEDLEKKCRFPITKKDPLEFFEKSSNILHFDQ